MSISRIPKKFQQWLDIHIKLRHRFFVGDAGGADYCMQTYLHKHYLCDSNDSVIVYHVGTPCRNNVGGWQTREITPPDNMVDFVANNGEMPLPDNPKRMFYTFKDIVMVQDADLAGVLWDGKSEGSLRNIRDMLWRNKLVVLYYAPTKRFYEAKERSRIEELVRQ